MPEVTRNLDRYFAALRPQVFKDYFNDQLRRIVPAPRRSLMLQVELAIRQSMVPSF